jgi:branched-chain amino acid transport system substrate-binding protein
MSDDNTFVERLQRRRFMRLAGMAGVAGLAGCSQEELQEDGGDGGGSDGGDGDGGSDGGDGGGDGGDDDMEESEPIRVGVAIPFSGDLNDFGTPMMNGLRLAQEDINAAGGPLGREIELNDEDTNTDATQGVNAASKLVETDGVPYLIGAVSSGVTISIAESVTIPNGVLHNTPASSSPAISTLEDDDLVFRTRTNDRFVAKVMARIITDEGADSAAVIYINNDFGLALADTFDSAFEGTTTTKVAYESGESSYQSILSEAFADDPEFVAFAGYPETGTTILTQWNEGGFGGNWVLHTSLLSDEVIDGVGAEVMSGMFGVRTEPPTGEATETFVSDYESEFPDAQVFDPYSWNSYDSLVSWALAVEKAGTTDPAQVKEELRGISNPPGEAVGYGEFEAGASMLGEGTDIDYAGPSGNVNYDENGDVASDMVVVEVVDGEFTNQRTVPASDLV